MRLLYIWVFWQGCYKILLRKLARLFLETILEYTSQQTADVIALIATAEKCLK